jgi:hypothetical protein
MSKTKGLTRRRTLKLAAAATTLPLVHIRTGHAAGTLNFGVWDHWVPAANPVLKKLADQWAAKNQVDLKIDYITGVGMKINVTMAAEATARTGHDIYAFDQWTVHEFAEKLEPVDDIMKGLVGQYGAPTEAAEYLGKVEGHWRAVPVGWGSAPLTPCGRISLFKKFANEDLTAWYPAKEGNTPGADAWTYEKQIKIAEACAKGGFPFGLGCGSNSTDANQTWGATFGAFGADLVNAKGEITVDTDNVKEVMEYCKRFVPILPNDTAMYDDASNNKILIAGRSAMIWNPPSAWFVATRDAPEVAADCWTFPNPKGKMGRLVPMRPYFWGIWNFSKMKPAAKDFLTWISQREQVEELTNASFGYDIPPFKSMANFKIWEDVAPPKGTVYNYPVRPWHDAKYYVPGQSAPPELAVQMWNRYITPSLVARMVQGQTVKQALDWAKQEIEGFKGR